MFSLPVIGLFGATLGVGLLFVLREKGWSQSLTKMMIAGIAGGSFSGLIVALLLGAESHDAFSLIVSSAVAGSMTSLIWYGLVEIGRVDA
jgi:hypothetical protein